MRACCEVPVGKDRVEFGGEGDRTGPDHLSDGYAPATVRVLSDFATVRSIRRQVLRFEEYESDHPVVVAGKELILELDHEKTPLRDEIAQLEGIDPGAVDEVDVESILSALPDLRQVITTYSDIELKELFNAFDLSIYFYKRSGETVFSVLLSDALAGALNGERPPGGGRISPSIAGAGFEPATSGLAAHIRHCATTP
jgi:hypothetical protein